MDAFSFMVCLCRLKSRRYIQGEANADRQQGFLQSPGPAGAAHRLPEPDAGGGGRGRRADAGQGGPERDDGGVPGHADPVCAEHVPDGRHRRGRDPGRAILGQGRSADAGGSVQPDAALGRRRFAAVLRRLRAGSRPADAHIHPRRRADRHRQRVSSHRRLVVSDHRRLPVLPDHHEGDGSRDAQRMDQLAGRGDEHRAERGVHIRAAGRAEDAGPGGGAGDDPRPGDRAGALPHRVLPAGLYTPRVESLPGAPEGTGPGFPPSVPAADGRLAVLGRGLYVLHRDHGPHGHRRGGSELGGRRGPR